jgi:hypothetical protein
MNRSAHPIQVSVFCGEVLLEQQFPNEGPNVITLTPEQIEMLIDWLREAAVAAGKGDSAP